MIYTHEKRHSFAGGRMFTHYEVIEYKGRIGAAGIGLVQLVMSVGSLAMVAGIGGIRTATMYLTAGELGRKKPQNVIWVLSGCYLYSILFSGTVSFVLYRFAPWIARNWVGDEGTTDAL